MREYPHTMENGAGERLTFVRRVAEADGDRLEGENLVAPRAGPPMHVHYLQEEGMTVVEGQLGFQLLDQDPKFAGPGDTVIFRAGEVHRFWNAGESDLRLTSYVKPAGNIEYFLGSLFASQKSNGGRRPTLFDLAFLIDRYGSEFGIVGIPTVVQRMVFPIIGKIGKAIGKYRKFADAPEPMISVSPRLE